jgi:DNA-binding NarL/FixJ family response regulator
MKPEQSRIFIAEDNEFVRMGLELFLSSRGHKVVYQADSLPSALQGVREARRLGVNVAILDGNLMKGETNCSDGRTVARALREEVPGVAIIGLTSTPNADYGDININKDGDAQKRLIQAIADL